MNVSDLVSVVIPCYNQSHFLGKAIESLFNQTYQNFEIIVVDDGSTDNEIALITSKFDNVRLIKQKNMGLADARNTGLRESTGEFIVFLDSDDRLLPNALEAGINSLREHPDCVFVSGFCRQIDQEGNLLPFIDQSRIKEGTDHYQALLQNNYIWTPANVIFRRNIFQKISAFDCSINQTADYDLYLRITRHFPVYQHGEIVSEYRQHETSMSSNHLVMLKHILVIFEAQKGFIKKNKKYQKAIRQGKRYYFYIYGKLILLRTVTLLKKKKWKESFHNLFIFIEYLSILFKNLTSFIMK